MATPKSPTIGRFVEHFRPTGSPPSSPTSAAYTSQPSPPSTSTSTSSIRKSASAIPKAAAPAWSPASSSSSLPSPIYSQPTNDFDSLAVLASQFPNALPSTGNEPPPTFFANKRPTNIAASIGRHPSVAKNPPSGPDDGINPVELLTKRLDAWRAIFKILTGYFEDVVDVELRTAKSYQKVSSVIQLPLKDTGHHWREKDGVQELCAGFRDGARNVASDHEEFAQFIASGVIPGLRNVTREIKERISAMQKDDKLSTEYLFKEVEQTRKAVAVLDKMCQLANINPQAATEKQDPWISNIFVTTQIRKQVAEENRLHRAILALQQQTKAFEGSVVEQLKSIVRTFYEWRAGDLHNYKENAAVITAVLERLQPDTEWNDFVEQHKSLLVSENARHKEVQDVFYSNKNNPFVTAVKQGMMERKTGVRKNWHDRHYVLTAAASIHEFKSSDDVTDPEISIFLPGSTVYLLSEKDDKKNPYCIEIRGRNNAGYISREKSFIFKANSREEQQDWFNKLTEASNRVFTTGPAPLPPGITPMEIHDSSSTPLISPQLDTSAVSSPTIVRALEDDQLLENAIYPPLDYQQKVPVLDGNGPTSDEEDIQEKIKKAQEQSANPPAKSILANSAGTTRKTTFDSLDSPVVIRQAPPLVSPIPKHAYTGPYQPQLASVHKEAQIKSAPPVSVDGPNLIEETASVEEDDMSVEYVTPVEAFPTSSVENIVSI